MAFDFLNPYPEIREAVSKICSRFDMNYWARCDREQVLATEFFEAIRDAGWLGITIPEALGGAGMPFGAVATMMQAVAESGRGLDSCDFNSWLFIWTACNCGARYPRAAATHVAAAFARKRTALLCRHRG